MTATVITVAGSILSAIVASVFTYALTRRREHETEWRKLKFGQYQEFVLALSGIIEGRSTPEAQARYSDAVNSMNLVAPSPVLRALSAFQSEISCRNKGRTQAEHDRLLNSLLREMRADMMPGRDKGSSLEFPFITTPPP
jgi:hypothetical protein